MRNIIMIIYYMMDDMMLSFISSMCILYVFLIFISSVIQFIHSNERKRGE